MFLFSHFRAMHPSISWAQRHNLVFLTINVEDVKDPEIKVEENRLYFKGTGGSDKKTYEANLELYGTLNAEVSIVPISMKHTNKTTTQLMTQITVPTSWAMRTILLSIFSLFTFLNCFVLYFSLLLMFSHIILISP